MAESQVQLKREEIVGDEVVLTDIDPVTSSDSVTHKQNGLTMDAEITRIWNSINDKLSRIVNSVNGRTGVVVLTAEDVGLGNVDNISFAEIQDWIIERMKQEFDNRAFKLFTYLDEADTILAGNDKSMSGCGFYSEHGRQQDNDNRSYIGVFWWDNASQTLQTSTRSIQIIGDTDASILYNELSAGRDYRNGKLGVNIWKDEDGLELYEGSSADPSDPKANSGLRLVRDNILPHFETMLGCYGSDFENPGDADDSWLYADMHPEGAPTVKIIYDGKNLSTRSTFYAKRLFKLKDQFICCFSAKYGYNYDTKSENLNLPAGVDPALVDQHNALGIVTEVIKDSNDVVTSYTVEFTPLTPRIGDGLCYKNYFGRYTYAYDPHDYLETMHNNQIMINRPTGATVNGVEYEDILDPSGTYIPNNYLNLRDSNISGLTIRSNRDQRGTDGKSLTPGVTGYAFTNLPAGPFPACDPRYRRSLTQLDGLTITPDASLCVMPNAEYGGRDETTVIGGASYTDILNCFVDGESALGGLNVVGSSSALNWKAPADFYTNDTTETVGTMSMLGINLNKAMMRIDPIGGEDQLIPALANISGLRIFQYAKTVDGRIFGGETAGDIPDNYQYSEMTGGLAINCGKFLKIEPSGYHVDHKNFYDGGRLTIDTGIGMVDDDGKLSIAISTGKGLNQYTDQQGTERLGIKLHKSGMVFKYDEEIGENGALTLTNYKVKHLTGIGLKRVPLSQSELTWFEESDNDYYDGFNTEEKITYAFGINEASGLQIDENNRFSIKNYTMEYVYDESGNKVIEKGKYKRKKIYHGLQFYGENAYYGSIPPAEGQTDPNFDPFKTGMNSDGLGVKIKDADGTSHGLEINEEGTLCVEEKPQTFKHWTIEGTEVIMIQGLEAERNKKTYEYVPNKDALTIKLGKGLIFVDDRSGGYDPDDPDSECPCGCGCINYDDGSGSGGGATFAIYDYIESDGTQKIDSIGVVFNAESKHIAKISYILTEPITDNTIIFEIGKNGNGGSQTIGVSNGSGSTAAPTASTRESANSFTKITIPQDDAGRMVGLRYDTTVTFQPALIEATWVDTSAHGDIVAPTASSSLAAITSLSDKLMALFGPSGVDNLTANSKIKFYGLKLYEDDLDHCIADFVPCKSSANWFGVFDKVNKRFYRSSSGDNDFVGGTPTGEVINKKGEPVTPPDPETLITYDLLEFIQSDGHQRITTTVEFNSSTSSHYIIPEIQTAALNDQIFYSIGNLDNVGSQYGGVSDGKKQFGIMDLSGSTTVNYSISQDPADVPTANPMIFEGYALYEKERLFIKWIEDNTVAQLTHITDSKDDFTVSSGGLLRSPVSLFAGVLNNETYSPSSIYMYGFKIAENDPANIIADFVPVISSENEIGLFDFISKTFVKKTDDSTAFIAGNRTGRRIDYRGNYI